MFSKCSTLEELKKEYRRAAMKAHPDLGGSNDQMKAVNAAYSKRFEQLKNAHNAQPEKPYTVTEQAEEFIDIIDRLVNLDGLNVELCGSWLWIGGETRKHKEALKKAGCKWHSKKQLWYWHGGKHTRYRKGSSVDMEEIRGKYGSKIIKGGYTATTATRKAIPA